jgi:putative endonuclease
LDSKDKRMALHNELGRTGEQLAAEYLSGLGYTILHRNWRYLRYEIDVVATKEQILHFIEVKTRQTTTFGLPEEDISRKKMHSLIQAAEAFVSRHPHWKRIQFDVLSVSLIDSKPTYYFIEDVYL